MPKDILISLMVLIENNRNLSSYELALKIKNEIIDAEITDKMFELISDYEMRLKECGR